ncbi:MAG: DUF2905 domain-containing protein [Anaerolineae bacterium]|nr:DUF2905 domain-containing protein [Anaerolineae bacterium]
MMDLNAVGRLVLFVGLALAALGGLLILLSRVPVLNRLGNLPGDIHIEGENFSCFFPIVSMILISIALSVALNLVLRLFNR